MQNVYAQPGQSFQQVGGTCPDGWVVMQEDRPTPEHVANDAGEWVIPTPTLADIHALRLAAYREESDPLKIEAEFDAQIAQSEPDYATWVEKVQEIKNRYPLSSPGG